jgi:hypothetical protein
MNTSSLGGANDVVGVVDVMGVAQLASNKVAEATRQVRSSVTIFMG